MTVRTSARAALGGTETRIESVFVFFPLELTKRQTTTTKGQEKSCKCKVVVTTR
jgi:hypothetical protein